jgi:hypothetical protein
MDFFVKRQWIIDVFMILCQSGYLIIYIYYIYIPLDDITQNAVRIGGIRPNAEFSGN